MNSKCIFFDLDGTLTDSGEGIINCAIYALEQLGLPVPLRESLRFFVGPPLHESFPRVGVPAELVDEAIVLYRKRYVPIGKFENIPYPGIRELLQQLKDLGYRLFVATSKPENLSVEILEHFKLDIYFERICGATSDASRSSKADVIAYLLALASDTDHPIMVGDTHYDVLGAKAHGIPTVGVRWGYGEVQNMLEAGAVAIADNPEQLLEILTK